MINQTESGVDPKLSSSHQLNKHLNTFLLTVKKYDYTYNFSLTEDEQPMPLKSRCSFVTFMPNKPDEYGVKFQVLADVETKCASNINVYLGAQEKEQRGGAPLAESVVVNLRKHIKKRGTA